MHLVTTKELRKYVAEILVIIIGILIAFQVEEWRQGLRQERDLQASLVRLKEETEVNLGLCATSIPDTLLQANNALAVVNALQSGQLSPESLVGFEAGLTNLGALYKPPFLSSVAEEMIATGLLKELVNADLRISVAGLPKLVQRVVDEYSDQRQAMNVTVNVLASRVEFHYPGPFNFDEIRGTRSEQPRGAYERAITVNYDFESLAGDVYFTNLMIEVADTYGDLHSIQRGLCRATERVNALMVESGE